MASAQRRQAAVEDEIRPESAEAMEWVISIIDMTEMFGHIYVDSEYGLNSILGTKYYTEDDMSGSLGWFARSKFVPLLSDEEFSLYKGWTEEGELPYPMPAWLLQRYANLMRDINKMNNMFMPNPISCEKCGSTAMVLETKAVIRKDYAVGDFKAKQKDDDGDEYDPNGLYSFANMSSSENRTAILKCYMCGDVSDDDDLRGRIYIS